MQTLPLVLLLAASAVSVHTPVLAQTPVPALIPLPRDVKRMDAPVRLRGPVVVVPGRDTLDGAAARVFVDALAERKVAASSGDSAASAWRVALLRAGTPAASALLARVALTFDAPMRAEGYVLVVDTAGAQIVGESAAGVFYGLQTLAQLIGVSPSGPTVRPAVIRDWPAMRWRGVHDDLSRGPIPTLEYQKRQIRLAAAYKINVWSPYYEQSLQYDSHPLASPPGGAMSHDDVRELVAYASRYHITLVPEQEAFGHLHHVLKNEIYSSIAETPRGHVLAPGDTASLALIRDMFTEISQLFPGPFIHLGADETDELGRGRTKARVDSLKLGPVYMGFLTDIVQTLRPITGARRFMFWGDVAGRSPELVKNLPKDMIAVAWGYGANEGTDNAIRPFRAAGLETWVAPGVSSWNRVWPNFGTALSNIRNFARAGQAGGSTGLLNTVWDDDGDAIFEQTWYGILFGAAASWQPGESSIDQFQNTFGQVFHGDTTGAINAAQRSLIAAHAALQRSRAGDGSTSLFFRDPWAAGDDSTAAQLRPVLSEVRIRAESALVYVARARKQTHLRESVTLDAMELGARRLDWLAAKYQYSDAIAAAFANASVDSVRAQQILRDLSWMNGTFQDMRDGYALTRELFERTWRAENRPYWMTNALARFDVEIQRWVERTVQFDQAMRRWALERTACAARARREQVACSAEKFKPRPEDVGMPPSLVPKQRM